MSTKELKTQLDAAQYRLVNHYQHSRLPIQEYMAQTKQLANELHQAQKAYEQSYANKVHNKFFDINEEN